MKSLTNTVPHRRGGIASPRRQAGLTLMETMISLALSVLVTAAMVVLMANSLGTATRIIHMSQLSDELRNAMSMMTRDIRRANHSANSVFCYGNSDCGAEGAIAEQFGDIQIANGGSCFTFALDRDFDGNAANDPKGGFRRVIVGADDIGVIEMWAADDAATPNCAAGPGQGDWLEVTDPNTVDITAFVIDDSASFSRTIIESEVSTFNNRQRQVQISVEGEIRLGNQPVRRRLEDTIYVRNDFIEI